MDSHQSATSARDDDFLVILAQLEIQSAPWFLQVALHLLKAHTQSLHSSVTCREVAGKRGVFCSAYTPTVVTAV